MSAVVYTAIFGDYDVLKQPVPQDEPCNFVCFTDTAMPSRVGVWRVIQQRGDPGLHPRMQAKWYKLLSHRAFPGGRLSWRYAPFNFRPRADMSIWIDGGLQIKSARFVRDMRTNLGSQDWAMFPHPARDCIYEEAKVSLGMRKYRDLPIAPQVASYRSIIPPHGGLYACTIIVRREPASQVIRDANEWWWNENLKWTYQDQVSLPYVLRQLGTPGPAKIAGNLWSNAWFEFLPHNSDA
jgi:hypothetical protein